jgi:hypothetical protein
MSPNINRSRVVLAPEWVEGRVAQAVEAAGQAGRRVAVRVAAAAA